MNSQSTKQQKKKRKENITKKYELYVSTKASFFSEESERIALHFCLHYIAANQLKISKDLIHTSISMWFLFK